MLFRHPLILLVSSAFLVSCAPDREAEDAPGGLSVGVVVVYAALILLFNLLVDLAYARMDPRIRLQE